MKKWILFFIIAGITVAFSQQWWETISITGASVSKFVQFNNSYYAILDDGPVLVNNITDRNWYNTLTFLPGKGGDAVTGASIIYIARNEKVLAFDPSSNQTTELLSNNLLTFHCIEKPDVNSIIVGTSDQTVYLSQDNGTSWQQYTVSGAGEIFDILKTPGDTLFAATQNGLYYSTDLGVTWTSVAQMSGIPLFRLAGNSSGHMVVSGLNSIFSFTSNNLNSFTEGFLAQSPKKINDVILTESDSIFVAGEFNYSPALAAGVFGDTNLDFYDPGSISSANITSIFYDETNGILLAAPDRDIIRRKENGAWSYEMNISYLNIDKAVSGVDRSGNQLIYWISGKVFGYQNITQATGRKFFYSSMKGDFSALLFKSPDSIFVGTLGAGCFMIDIDGNLLDTLVLDVAVSDMILLPSQKLIISTIDSGLFSYDLTTHTMNLINSFPVNKPVFSLNWQFSKNGGFTIYAGTEFAEIYTSPDEGQSWSSEFITTASGEGDILSIYEDPDGNIFAGTRGLGLYVKLNGQSWTQVPTSEMYGRIKAITGSVYNEVFVGTEDGLKRYNFSTGTLMDEVFNDFAIVTSFDISPEGDLIVGYHGGGIAIYHGFNIFEIFVLQPEAWSGLGSGDIVAFDYDLDQDYDILVCGVDSTGVTITELWEKTPSGYQPSSTFSIPSLKGQFDLGDVDNDGDLDILFAGDEGAGLWTVRIYYNNQGSIGSDYITIANPANAITKFGDFNNDGKLDVFVHGDYSGEGLKAKFYYNIDARNFLVGPSFTGIDQSSCAVADLNVDGFLDVVLIGGTSGTPESKIFRNDSARTMVEITGGVPAFMNPKIKVADVNSDGLPDLVFSGINFNGSADLLVAINNNNFSFTPMTSTNLPFIAGGLLEVADFNGDGLIDIFLSGLDDSSNPKIEMYTFDGSVFNPVMGIKAPPFVTAASTLVDFDGDGDLDICTIGVDDQNVFIGGVLLNLFDNPTLAPNDIVTLYVVNQIKGDVKIVWNPESDDQTPTSALQYNIKIDRINTTQNGAVITPAVHPANGTFPLTYENSNSGYTPFHFVKNLPPGDYQVTVQAIDNGWQFSNFSVSAQFTIQPWLEPPQNLKGIALANQILISWSPVAVSDFKYYRIYMAEGAGSFIFLDSTQVGLPEDTTFVVKNITPDTDYQFYITTVLQTGEVSGPSDTLYIHTPVTTIPAPELVHAFPKNGAIQLVWTQSTVADFNNYNIFVGDSPFNLKRDTVIYVRSDTVVQLTGLTNGKVFYFAVSIATTAALESPLSNILGKAPGIPEIVAVDASPIAADSFKVKYIVAPAGNTVTNIALQVAQSQNFNTFQTFIPPVRQVSGDNPSPFTPAFGLLNPNQKYFVRVTGNYDSSGTSLPVNSNILAFVTFPAQVMLEFPENTSVLQDPEQTLSWFSAGTNVIYQLQVKEGDSDFSTGNFYYDLDSITTTSVQLNFDFGRTYYWRVRAKNEAGPGKWSDVFAFSIEDAFSQNITVNYVIDFREKPASDYGPEDYKLFGVPGDIGDPLRNYMSGNQGSDWRIFYDNGNPTNYLEEDDGSGQFSLGGGRAFWVISTRDVTINASFPAPTVYRMDTIYYTPINIHSGWNIITSPFPYDVPWAAIKLLNNLPQGQILYGYDNGSYYQSGFLKANEGFYFENTTGKFQLLIPHQISFSKLSKTGFRKSASDLDVFVKIGIQKTSSQAVVPVLIGTSGEALNDEDPLDLRIPLNPFGGEQLYVRTGDDNSRDHAYQTWIRSNSNELDDWTLVLSGEKGKTYTLNIVEESLPPTKVAYLINTETSEWFDLANTKQISVTLYRSSAELKVLIGDEQQVASEMENYVPVEFKLQPNYPNPFNPTTTFTLEIPERVEVTFEIYNILGKKVKTLYHGTMEKGIRYLTWDAKDDAGNEVPAGIYFYQVRTSDGKLRTGKMVYLK